MSSKVVWKGVPELKQFIVPLSDVILDENNARVHPNRNLDVIASSFQEFGQDIPIIASKSTKVVAIGNGRLQVAKALGWTHIACLFRDDDAITMLRRALVDNKSAELADWDYKTLSKLFGVLKAEGTDFETIGWEDYEVAPLLEAEWSSEGGDDIPDPHVNSTSERSSSSHNTVDFLMIRLSGPNRDEFEKAAALIKEAHNDASDGDVVRMLSIAYMATEEPATER